MCKCPFLLWILILSSIRNTCTCIYNMNHNNCLIANTYINLFLFLASSIVVVLASPIVVVLYIIIELESESNMTEHCMQFLLEFYFFLYWISTCHHPGKMTAPTLLQLRETHVLYQSYSAWCPYWWHTKKQQCKKWLMSFCSHKKDLKVFFSTRSDECLCQHHPTIKPNIYSWCHSWEQCDASENGASHQWGNSVAWIQLTKCRWVTLLLTRLWMFWTQYTLS